MSDVCLILEGTYPYVSGGVSNWAHNFITAMPEIRFSLLTIMPSRSGELKPKYRKPANVVAHHKIYLHDYDLSDHPRGKAHKGDGELALATLKKFYDALAKGDYALLGEVDRLVGDPQTRVISPKRLFADKRIWEMVVAAYGGRYRSESFLDYFWTWRYSHLPLAAVLEADIPRARIYHTLCTGYAGLAGVIARHRMKAPLLLTEHGIYTNERRIEIEQARWIHERRNDGEVLTVNTASFKRIWLELFNHMSGMCYRNAEAIISLFEGNRRLQIADGADPRRARVIANGINLTNFQPRASYEFSPEGPAVGFVGRVVPIKDVRTFIRAARIVHERFPNARFPIIGPTDEVPTYFTECREMVETLGLTNRVIFVGKTDTAAAYRKLDIVVLTSFSEVMPLVMLEAGACGIPCVATDVGACSELLNGRLLEHDAALGPSGLITPIANPEATAAAIIRLLENDSERRRMGETGRRRIERFYNEETFIATYADLYAEFLGRKSAGKSGTVSDFPADLPEAVGVI